MIKKRSDPGADRLMAILDVLGTSVAFWVLTGVEISAQDEEFFRLASSLDPELREEALRLFRLMQARGGGPKPPPSQDS